MTTLVGKVQACIVVCDGADDQDAVSEETEKVEERIR